MLFKKKILFSSFVTPDFKKRQNGSETPLKNGTKFTRTFVFFGDKTPLVLKVQTRTTLEQKMMPIRKWAIPYNNT